MNLAELLKIGKSLPLHAELFKALRGGYGRAVPLPLAHAARSWLIAMLQADWSRPILVLCPSIQRARQLREEVQSWSSHPESVLVFAEPDGLFYERIVSNASTRQERLGSLSSLLADSRNPNSHLVVIASARAAMHKLMDKSDFEQSTLEFRVGGKIKLGHAVTSLVEAGYEAVNTVEEPGTFARRGGILDVFPPTGAQPYRIELFGDEVESIRLFDPVSQRSEARVEAVRVGPAREALPSRVRHALLSTRREFAIDHQNQPTSRQYEADIDRLLRGDSADLLELYAAYTSSASILDYAPSDALLIIEDYEQLLASMDETERQSVELRTSFVERGLLPPEMPVPYFGHAEMAQRLTAFAAALWLTWESAIEPNGNGWAELCSVVQPVTSHGGRLKVFLDECQADQEQGSRVVVVSHQASRLGELLEERGVHAAVGDNLAGVPAPGSLTLLKGHLAEGFRIAPPGALTIYTDLEIFGWSKPRRQPGKRRTSARAVLEHLEPGDYVVHIEHGIARFVGLQTMTADGVQREYAVLEYADEDRLYVPVEQISRITRYIGASGVPPTVHRLGTADWARVKDRVRKAVQDVAKELLEIYAARQVKQGHAFSPDSPWQADLEASFPYVETPDQLEVIREVKADMEQPKPMDRLVCGDVGYGKTEVALRAAFKAVLDGKQVAVLVPTTVLAQQHYKTFEERLQAFPVRVEVLSRFRSEKEQKLVLAGLADGTVDICIGTHRLIQRDVQFKDLGLVIIDEEQRFGVMHKERLKQLRKEVDVLTLSATPIPRTLHTALVGIRDMSAMDTPPEDRLPIKTFVTEYEDGLIREAILRELDRGGQVYFVHNRVQNIEFIAQRLRALVPEASVVVGHGQMPEDQLERVMLEFALGQHDVLVCSTIIESGLDIPNVNTIIINQADRLGLAQLYQLRGRVGRGANQAYAYFLFNRDKRLTPQAEKRLRAMFEASELGAGFRIAMRDLEIRGAGNLLGPEQHGHVAAVGFTLYCQLLAEAVREYQGKPEPRAPEVKIDLPVVAFIPSGYVEDDSARLGLYRRMAGATSLEEVADIAREVVDRFGSPPREVVNLLCLLEIKQLAARAGVESMTGNDREVVMTTSPELATRTALQRAFGPALKLGHRQARINRVLLGKNWLMALRDGLEAASAGQPLSIPAASQPSYI